MQWFDSHGHPHDPSYTVSVDEILFNAANEGVSVLAVGTDFSSSRVAAEIARKHPGCYAAIGVHPHAVTIVDGEVVAEESFDQLAMDRLVHEGGVVAVGECGLDYSQLPEDEVLAERVKTAQMDLFREQLEYAADRDLPITIHCRDAYDDLISLAHREPQLFAPGAAVHCFTGTHEQAKALVDAGLYIGITGIVTFKGASALREAIHAIPDNFLLLETDAPYLAPEPHRGGVNFPQYVSAIGVAVAELREVSVEDIARITTENASRLFRVNPLLIAE